MDVDQLNKKYKRFEVFAERNKTDIVRRNIIIHQRKIKKLNLKMSPRQKTRTWMGMN